MAYPFPSQAYSHAGSAGSYHPTPQYLVVPPPRSASRHSHHRSRSHSHSGHREHAVYPQNLAYTHSVCPLSAAPPHDSSLHRTRAIIIATPRTLPTPCTTTRPARRIISRSIPTPHTPTTLTPARAPPPMPMHTSIRANAPPPSAIVSASSLAWIVPTTIILLLTHTETIIITGAIIPSLASEMTRDSTEAILPARDLGSLAPLIIGAISMSTAERSITTDELFIECSARFPI
ncbi:hypothetical protein HD554DRAFT_2166067 [Boletus coccyginus]|nr:hypothetical protein HD554DRAFT_2166067 [Boletus coccyginus]